MLLSSTAFGGTALSWGTTSGIWGARIPGAIGAGGAGGAGGAAGAGGGAGARGTVRI